MTRGVESGPDRESFRIETELDLVNWSWPGLVRGLEDLHRQRRDEE